jgi:hypothetical protein
MGVGLETYLTQITLGDIWALLFIQGALNLIALGLIHGHQR